MTIVAPSPKPAPDSQRHVFVMPVVRELPRPTEPASVATTW
jgi:hypothetical protein